MSNVHFHLIQTEDITVKNVIIRLSLFLFSIMFLVAPAMAGEVNLSAATSLRDALNELSNTYAKDNPGVTFVKNYGASGAIAKQIENGAPADLLLWQATSLA